MKNVIKAFIAPHIDENYALCQDRIFVDSSKMFFSVSDGVSSSFAQTYYAELISSYESDNISLTPDDALSIFSSWKDYMEQLKQANKLGRASKQRFTRGDKPAATFARLKFKKQNEKLLWSVAVLGDCTIIHLNPNEGIEPIHVITSGEKFKNDNFRYNGTIDDYYRFGRMPDQLDERGTMLCNQAVLESNETLLNDCFILMTDGLSDWVLNNPKHTNERLALLLNLETQDDFLKLLQRERDENREIENDDMSFIKIAINNLDDFEIDAKSYITDINELIKIEKSNKITNHKENESDIQGQISQAKEEESSSEFSKKDENINDKLTSEDTSSEKKNDIS